MSEEKAMMIGAVQLGKTKSGKVKVDLYSTDKRLEYPVLTLFDLSMLELVGIDPNDLGADPVYKRFWAYYTESDKTTDRGNPYKDVTHLEPMRSFATDDPNLDPDVLTAILKELVAMHKTLRTTVSTGRTGTVALGDGDENADWIADEATRAEEQAIHDELSAQHQAAQDNHDVPMDSAGLGSGPMNTYLVIHKYTCPTCGGDGRLYNDCWEEANAAYDRAKAEVAERLAISEITDEDARYRARQEAGDAGWAAMCDYWRNAGYHLESRWPPEEHPCSECDGEGIIREEVELADALKAVAR